MLPSIIKDQIEQSLDLRLEFEGEDIENLVKALSIPIKDLLDNDLEKLLVALYRIDVSENKFREVISSTPTDKVHLEVSRLIVERQIQKLEFRRKYGSDPH